MLQSNETLGTPEAVEQQLRETIRAATGRVMLALPAQHYPALAPDLVDAVDDGVVVALLTYGGTPEAGPPVSEATTLYRSWEVTGGLTMLSTDRRDGFVAPNVVWEGTDGVNLVAYDEHPCLDYMTYSTFLAHVWDNGDERHVAAPPALPVEYDDLRNAVITATLHLDDDRPVDATIEGRPARTDEPFRDIAARVVATRQQFVYPRTSPTYGVTQLVVRHESGMGADSPTDGDAAATVDERLTVGGMESYIEDIEARAVRLRPAE